MFLPGSGLSLGNLMPKSSLTPLSLMSVPDRLSDWSSFIPARYGSVASPILVPERSSSLSRVKFFRWAAPASVIAATSENQHGADC